jgi:CheY-like chemotaxis protein
MRQRAPDQMPTILIIENDPSNRLLAERILSLAGYRVVEAAHGQAALRLLDGEAVDMIVTDLSMPGLDGFELIRLIRARPVFADIPIIAVTAHAFEAERQRALQSGCAALLVKPYRANALLALVERHLAQPASGATL